MAGEEYTKIRKELRRREELLMVPTSIKRFPRYSVSVSISTLCSFQLLR